MPTNQEKIDAKKAEIRRQEAELEVVQRNGASAPEIDRRKRSIRSGQNQLKRLETAIKEEEERLRKQKVASETKEREQAAESNRKSKDEKARVEGMDDESFYGWLAPQIKTGAGLIGTKLDVPGWAVAEANKRRARSGKIAGLLDLSASNREAENKLFKSGTGAFQNHSARAKDEAGKK